MANIYRFRNQSVAFENTITSTLSSGTNLTIANNSSSSGVPLTVFQGSLSTSAKTQLKLGVAASANNTGILQFNYSGNSSTSNSLGIGLEGSENLLQVSGTTISSILPITNTISTGTNLTLTNNASSSQAVFKVYQPNLANAGIISRELGVNTSNFNFATQRFVYTATGSVLNYLGIGLKSVEDIIAVNGNQRVGINNTAPSFTLDVTGTIRATALISANLGLTVTGATTSVTSLTASALISANLGLTVTGANTSVTTLSSSGLISANLGLTVTGANTSVTTLSSSGLISANLGLTVTGANTSVTTLSSSGLISANLGLTVTGATTSVTSLTASGLITGNAGVTNSNNTNGIGTTITNLNSNTGSSAFSLMSVQNSVGSCVLYINSTTRSSDGAASGATLRNDIGELRLQGNAGTSTILLSGGLITTTALTASGLITASAGLTSTAGATTLGTTTVSNSSGTLLALSSTSSAGDISTFTNLIGSLPNGARNNMVVGKAFSTNNSATYRYFHTADGSTSNYTTIGFFGNDDILTVQATKNVGINQTAPSVALDVTGSNYILNSIVVGGSMRFPPTALSGSPTTITGQTYGNGVYTPTASSFAVTGQESWRAFEYQTTSEVWTSALFTYNNTTGVYTSSNTTTIDSVSYSGEWLQIQLPVRTQLYRYEIYPRGGSESRAPNIFYVAGSNDGSTWTMIDSRTGISGYTSSGKQFTVTFNVLHNGFLYYRLISNTLNANPNSGCVSIAEWILYANNNTVGTSTSLSPETKTLIQSGNITVTNTLGTALTIGASTQQYPAAISIAPSAHATSRRAGFTLGNWQIVQDVSGNGTLDFGLYDSTTRFYISSTGNVGIGVNNIAPVFPLSIFYTSTNTSNTTFKNNIGLEIYNFGVPGSAFEYNNLIAFTDNNSTQAAIGAYRKINQDNYLSGIQFLINQASLSGRPTSNNTASSSLTEAMRITPEGNVGINNTAPSFTLDVTGNARVQRDAGNSAAVTVSNLDIQNTNSGTNAGAFMRFLPQNQTTNYWNIGSEGSNTTNTFRIYNQASTGVYMNSGSTAWSANSDFRIKRNIVDITDGLNVVLQLEPVTYNFISDGANYKKRGGFIAQNVQQVLPDIVSSHVTEEFPDGLLGISMAEMIPYIVKSIHNLNSKIQTQQNTIDTLTNFIKEKFNDFPL